MTSGETDELYSWALQRAKKHRLNEADAEDCAQEALLRYVEHKSVLDDEGGIRRWLGTVVDNIIRDNYRASKRESSPVLKRKRKRQQKAPLPREPNFKETPGAPIYSPVPTESPKISVEDYHVINEHERLMHESLGRVFSKDLATFPLPDRRRPYRDRIDERVERWLTLGFTLPRRLREFYAIWQKSKGNREVIAKVTKKCLHSTRRDVARLCKWFDELEAIHGSLQKFVLMHRAPKIDRRLNELIALDCMRHFRPAALRKLVVFLDRGCVREAMELCRGRYARRKGFIEECAFEQLLQKYPALIQVKEQTPGVPSVR